MQPFWLCHLMCWPRVMVVKKTMGPLVMVTIHLETVTVLQMSVSKEIKEMETKEKALVMVLAMMALMMQEKVFR